MSEQIDKTKSNDQFITTTNPTYQEQLNKNKYFGGNNNLNNIYNMNLVPKNRMNIIQNNKSNKQKQLSSDLNYKALCIIIVVLLFFGVISILLIYFLKQDFSNEKENSESNSSKVANELSALVNETKAKNESRANESFIEYKLNNELSLSDNSTNKSQEINSKTN